MITDPDEIINQAKYNKYRERNPTVAVFIQGYMGLGTGSIFLFLGIPSSYATFELDSTIRIAVGLIPWVGGLLLVISGYTERGYPWLEVLGYMNMVMFYGAIMTVGFILAYFDGILENPYPVVIYSGLTALTIWNLAGLYKFLGFR